MFSVNFVDNGDGLIDFTIVKPDTCYVSGWVKSLADLWKRVEEVKKDWERHRDD